jgi:hypothetical protein
MERLKVSMISLSFSPHQPRKIGTHGILENAIIKDLWLGLDRMLLSKMKMLGEGGESLEFFPFSRSGLRWPGLYSSR